MPTPQSTQPLLEAYGPAAHTVVDGTHELAPAAEVVPEGQAAQAEEPAAEAKLPAGQMVQSLPPEADAVPREHERHWAIPTTEAAIEYFPPGQLEQATEPTAAW